MFSEAALHISRRPDRIRSELRVLSPLPAGFHSRTPPTVAGSRESASGNTRERERGCVCRRTRVRRQAKIFSLTNGAAPPGRPRLRPRAKMEDVRDLWKNRGVAESRRGNRDEVQSAFSCFPAFLIIPLRPGRCGVPPSHLPCSTAGPEVTSSVVTKPSHFASATG